MNLDRFFTIKSDEMNLSALLIIVFLSVTLVFIWFHPGMIMGGGDIGLPFYRPRRIFEVERYTWWDDVAPGATFSNTLSSLPFYTVLAALSSIGIPDFAIQALVFLFVLVVGGASVYFLSLTFIGDDRTRGIAGVLAGLFYMLNPFSLVLVWHRFAPPSMLFSALLPLGLLLTVRALKSKRIFLPAFAIALLTVAFSYCFSSPALLLTFWIVILSYLLFHVVCSKGSTILHVVKFSIVLVVLFALVNCWWFIPYLYEYNIPLVAALHGFKTGSSAQNLGSYAVLDVSRLFSRFYLVIQPLGNIPYEHGHFGLIYTTPFFQLISFMIPIITFATFLFKCRDRSVLYFAFISILGIFLAKGAAPPLGEAMQWLVGNFLLFGPLRTAFDKLGFIVALGYSFLFGVGIASLYVWVRDHQETHVRSSVRRFSEKAFAVALVSIVCFSFFGLYQWPMWTGDVFRKGDGMPDYRVSVPSYYSDAREWLSTQPDGRIIAMPFGGVLTYTWPPYGYHGCEGTELLLNRPVLGKLLSLDYFDEILVHWGNLYATNQMWKFMNLFGARFLMVRHDIEYPDSSAFLIGNPDEIEFVMQHSLSFVSWEEKIAPYSPPSVTIPPPVEKQIYYGNSTEGFTAYSILNPKFEVEQTEGINGTSCAVMRGDPVNRNFGAFYELDRGKGNWTNFSVMEMWIKASQPGTLFVEAHDSESIIRSWDGRGNPTYAITPSQTDSWQRLLFPLPEGGITNVTRLLMLLLNMPSNQTTYLKVGSIKVSTLPSQVLKEGVWNITWGLDGHFSSSENEAVIYKVKPEGDGRMLAISYEIPLSLRNFSNFTALRVVLNVTSSGNVLFIATDSKNRQVSWDGRYDEYFCITGNDVGAWRSILLDLELKKSSIDLSNVTSLLIGMTNVVSPYVELHIQDICGIVKEYRLVPNPHINCVRSIGELGFYELDEAYFLDKIYATNKLGFSPNAYTMLEMMDEQSFIPGDTLVFLESQQEISDYGFLKSLNSSAPLYKPNITFRQIDPTHYEVSVANATQAFFLFFGETYHPLWTASIHGAGEIPENHHFIMNGYGNAWYINKTGTYKIDIKFTLQTIFDYCVIALVITLIACIFYLAIGALKSRRGFGKWIIAPLFR